MFKPNLAVKNLKGVVIVIVLVFHSVLAYLSFSPAASFAFNDPPYRWLSIPIVDSERWFGFDLFCALQDLYLMTLMFFISGLFVWPSLARKGSRTFLFERALRLALPFCLVVGLLMPLAYYPVYRLTAADTSFAAYREHFLALPFWPSGPPWFLGVLLVFNLAAALVYQLSRNAGDVLPLRSVCPRRFIIVLLLASAVAYVPLALMFTPWRWTQFGRSGFSSAGRCTMRSIFLQASLLAPGESTAVCSQRTERWCKAGTSGLPPRRSRLWPGWESRGWRCG